jgi:hypothetical protein
VSFNYSVLKECSLMRRAALLAVLIVGATLSGCAGFGKAAQQKERLAKARAMFEERCKTSGVKVHRKVEGVEGVLLLKVRPEGINRGDQYAMDDPYGRDYGGEAYIASLLRGFHQHGSRGTPAEGSPPRLGYDYVDVINPTDGQRYRHTGEVREVEATSSITMGRGGKKFKTTKFVVDNAPAQGDMPSYGVTFDDISTKEERDYWIAGSSLRVVDLKSSEVIAERIGYMMDPGQGNDSGGRAPWLLAASNACPSFFRNPKLPVIGPGFSAQTSQTLDFVESVLQPRRDAMTVPVGVIGQQNQDETDISKSVMSTWESQVLEPTVGGEMNQVRESEEGALA